MKPQYPDGFVTSRPKWLTPHAYLDALGRYAKRAKPCIGVFLTDFVSIGLLWILVSYCVIWFSTKSIGYMLVPWWVFLVGVVEGAAVWESFGRSLGHRLVGRCLVPFSAETPVAPPTFGRRILHFLAWHISLLPLLGLLWKRPLHERLSGTALRRLEKGSVKPVPWFRTTSGVFIAVLILVITVAAVGVTVTWENLVRLFTEAYRAAPMWRALVRPETSILFESVQDLIVTVFMAVMATGLAVLFAVPLSFLAARNLSKGLFRRTIYTLIRGAMSILRSIEPIIWAIIFLVWVTSLRAAFAGLLALWVHSIADLTKLYAEQLEGIDTGLVEAITSTGAPRLQVIRYGVVPQIVNPYISFTLYRFDINIRMGMIVGLIGAGGIGQRLFAYIDGRQYSLAGTVMLLIIATVWIIDYASGRLRAKLL